jgi:hypothetical protein
MREDAGPRRAGINMHDLIDDAAPLRGVRHDKAGSAGIACEAVELLRKPYRSIDLAERVRAILDRSDQAAE